MIDFYDYLKSHFNDLPSAKKFFIIWRCEWEQDIPGHPEWSGGNCFSIRSMAAHISNVLEGKSRDISGLITTNYITTKYGSDILFV